LQKKGKLAAELLVKSIQGELGTFHKVLNTKLVTRASVAPPGVRTSEE
jgi:DNA-binding LacI/PurR family transcriptional regulator